MKNCLPKEIDDTSSKLEYLLKDLRRKGISAFKDLKTKEQKAVIDWSKVVTREYFHLVDNNLSNVKDIADLPYPKEDIKLALKMILPIYVSSGPRSMIKRLKLAYQELGAFQQINTSDKETILDPTVDRNTDNSKKMRDRLALYDKYLKVTIAERKILVQEIGNYVENMKYSNRN